MIEVLRMLSSHCDMTGRCGALRAHTRDANEVMTSRYLNALEPVRLKDHQLFFENVLQCFKMKGKGYSQIQDVIRQPKVI